MISSTAQTLIASLAELFPAAFTCHQFEPHKPLKLGIHEDLVATGVVTEAEVNQALRWYCTRLMYHRAVAAGGIRVGLDGEPAGEITADEMEHAKHAVARIEAARAKRVAAEKAARRSGKTVKAAPPPEEADRGSDAPAVAAEAEPRGFEGCRAGARNRGALMRRSRKPEFSLAIRGEPSPRHRRRSRLQIQAMLSAAERQRAALPADHPRNKPTLPRLKCLLEAPG
jgi:ProP effector